MGLYNHHKSLSPRSSQPALTPCSDMCGVVAAVGPAGPHTVSPWRVGDRVLSTFNQSHLTGQIRAADLASGLGKPLDGVLRTHRVFPTTGLVRCPDYLSDEEGACLPIAAVTAWMAINGFREIGKSGGEGETVVLQGTGGVAVAGLQIAKASGARGELVFLSRYGLGAFADKGISDYYVVLGREAREGKEAGRGLHRQLPRGPRLAGRGDEVYRRRGRGHHPRDGRSADAAEELRLGRLWRRHSLHRVRVREGGRAGRPDERESAGAAAQRHAEGDSERSEGPVRGDVLFLREAPDPSAG